jgi:magnesium-transporting ATPase (P-type)
MNQVNVGTKDSKKVDVEDLFKKLSSRDRGLDSQEAEKRLGQYGYNEIVEKEENPVLKFLQHWTDLVIILVMLLFNALVGFWQEYQASNALEALKNQLALRARVRRDGKWQGILARELVPGDVIRLRPGDIIPADVKLFDGDYLNVDESALTGESLPVDKSKEDVAYSGSIAKQGEMIALVTATGGFPFSESRSEQRRLPDIHQSGPCCDPYINTAFPWRLFSCRFPVHFDPGSRRHPGRHARGALCHHGPGCTGSLQRQGDRLPASID